jgi:hypothetical protein
LTFAAATSAVVTTIAPIEDPANGFNEAAWPKQLTLF